MKDEVKDKRNKFSLWCLVIWNTLILGGALFAFGKLLQRKFAGAPAGKEELVFLVLIPIFLIVNIKPVCENVKKLCLLYQENSTGKILQNEPATERYAFMQMYRKLSRRRICLALAFPLLYILTLAALFPILSHGIFSWRSVPMLFTRRTMQLAFLPAVAIAFFVSLKIYVSSRRNLDTLQQVYERSSRQELEDIDSIKEKQAAYVFTEEFLINWDGCLNIVPLKEIRKIKYVKYYYLLLHGTRLRITCSKKYVIWSYGPSEAEWIERGFIAPSGRPGKAYSCIRRYPRPSLRRGNQEDDS